MYGKDFQYAHTRLQETIVSFKDGMPVFIWSVDDNGLAKYSLLSDLDVSATAPLEALDLTPVKLGFVNSGPRTSYLVRRPMRNDWRQGTRFQQMQSFGQLEVRHFSYRQLFDTIVGNFPSAKEVVDSFSKKVVLGQAFHRHWAIMDGSLYHRHQIVGQIVKGKIVLDKQFNYLKECLEEAEQ